MQRLLDKAGAINGAELWAARETHTDCLKLIDLDGRLTAISGAGCRAMQIAEPGLVEGKLWRELWPEESASLIDDALFEARANGTANFSAFCEQPYALQPQSGGCDRTGAGRTGGELGQARRVRL